MITYNRGEKTRVYVEVRDTTGALTDPTSVAVSVYDALLTKVITSQALTKSSLGVYTGSVSLAATWIRGRYVARIEATFSTDIVYEDNEFFLEVLD